MRTIKFRGKRVDTKEWVYGDIAHHDNRVSYIGQNNYDGGMVVHDLIEETVGQFTGLTDKNGKEIYEGDICEYCWQHPLDHNSFIGFIEYENCAFYLFNDNTHESVNLDVDNGYKFEVIGNIHDNQELLKGEN